jgi:hypothetical protein
VESVLANLRNDPEIEFAERDYLARAAFVPNDPYLASGQEWHLAAIHAPEAWNITRGTGNIVVAVLDSGVNAQHPDLAGQTLPGYDFVNNSDTPMDDFGHGTAVTGTLVAAGNNGFGVVGVAFSARVLPVKVMDSSGLASYSAIAQGIDYAVDQGARVINISIVGTAPSAALQAAVDYAWSNNVVIVAAAGNSADSTPLYPAACDHVVGVSATEPDDSLAPFSSYGADVALSAPGDTIWTTRSDLTNPYGPWRGTSFASPIVAGVAALVASENPALSNTQIVSLLEQSADDLGLPGWDPSFGYGRINAFSAVTAASTEAGALPPQSVPAPAWTLSSPADSAQFASGSAVPVSASVPASSGAAAVTNVLFLANDQPFASCASGPFALSWTPDEPGSYTLKAVAIDDQGLCSTSAPVVIQVLDTDANAPVLRITRAPANGSRLASPQVFLAGTARDADGLDHIEVQVNGAAPWPADGTTNWSAQLLLAPGRNAILVRIVDAAGNASAALERVLTWVVDVPLTVQTNGIGAVTPNLDGRLLEIGKLYTVKAAPGPGQAFAGWTGLASVAPVLRFVMQSNLVLTANFVPSPFPAVNGAYAGLIASTNGVSPENSGFFTVSLTKSGPFTGKLIVGGKGYGFRGRFDLEGNAAVTVKRGRLNPVALALHVDLTNGTDQITGIATAPAWVSEIAGERNVFRARSNPALQAGLRAFILQNADNAFATAATGSSSISAAGRARVRGRLLDGRSFSAASLLAKNGDCPLYISFNRGNEIVIGWLNFPATPAPTAAGTVLWVKTGTNAFAATLQAASDGTMAFTDTNGMSYPARFYRLSNN